jgi:hypothetical protein
VPHPRSGRPSYDDGGRAAPRPAVGGGVHSRKATATAVQARRRLAWVRGLTEPTSRTPR